MACLARLSDTGFFPTKIARGERSSGTLAQKDSIAWLSASMPECAVTCGGHETVSDGSTNAHFGIMRRVAIPTFMNRSGSATTATGLTSEPVPDVVGMQTMSIKGPGT